MCEHWQGAAAVCATCYSRWPAACCAWLQGAWEGITPAEAGALIRDQTDRWAHNDAEPLSQFGLGPPAAAALEP